jgi:peptide/nickel transport system ATP-binding protein
MMDLRRETGASMLIITHDLGIVAETCDRVAVMYAGDIVEEADVCSLFDAPHHPYTIGLLGAVPTLARDTQVLKTIPGVVPSLIGIGPGCRFNPRCQFATDLCRRDKPARVPVAARHFVACHHTDAVLAGRLERSANV